MNAPLHPTIFQALRGHIPTVLFEQPAIEQPNKPTTVPANLYEYQYADGDGLVLDCHLEYEAHESASHDCPGTPECITLIYALCNGVDVANVLSEEVTDVIEEEALCSMAMDKWNDDYDCAADRYEDRLAA